jgi:hypothetical protein
MFQHPKLINKYDYTIINSINIKYLKDTECKKDAGKNGINEKDGNNQYRTSTNINTGTIGVSTGDKIRVRVKVADDTNVLAILNLTELSLSASLNQVKNLIINKIVKVLAMNKLMKFVIVNWILKIF